MALIDAHAILTVTQLSLCKLNCKNGSSADIKGVVFENGNTDEAVSMHLYKSIFHISQQDLKNMEIKQKLNFEKLISPSTFSIIKRKLNFPPFSIHI